MLNRKEYLDRLIRWREKQLIKVVTGVRRCGKSTLFSLYIDYLKKTGVTDGQIVFINLEDVENERLHDYKALYAYVNVRLSANEYTYVFIDEAQQCPQYEKAVDSLYIKKNVDIYITGSNAYMLSGELATLLSGRYVEIRMLPLSFTEYLMFTNAGDMFGYDPIQLKSDFNDYLLFGSFPYAALLNKDKTFIRNYLEGIYNTILIKDVAKRENINDVSVLESVVKFLCGSIGSPISIKKISDVINSGGRKISVNTVDRYIRALTDSFLFYKTDRFDIKGGQVLKTLGKYYIVDAGLKDLLVSSSGPDLGHLLENIIYLELIRRGYKVNIGKLAEKEVDFVAQDENGYAYYQVSASTLDDNTLKRELEPLQKIGDNYPKFLLTLDDYIPDADYSGIRKTHVINWLLNI